MYLCSSHLLKFVKVLGPFWKSTRQVFQRKNQIMMTIIAVSLCYQGDTTVSQIRYTCVSAVEMVPLLKYSERLLSNKTGQAECRGKINGRYFVQFK